MRNNAQRYPFVPSDVALGEASFRPYLPLTLAYHQSSVAASGLLDTGASVNVLPYSVGIELGVILILKRIMLPISPRSINKCEF